MVVEVRDVVGREQRVKVLPRQCVRVRVLGPQHHQAHDVDVDDADVQRGRELTQQLSRPHDFEGQLGAGAYENDVRVRAVPCRAVPCRTSEFLDEGTGPAVRFGFFGGEEDGGELFRADHQVDMVFRA